MGSVDARIAQYGIFDSSVSMPEVTETRNRLLTKYEFELYPAEGRAAFVCQAGTAPPQSDALQMLLPAS